MAKKDLNKGVILIASVLLILLVACAPTAQAQDTQPRAEAGTITVVGLGEAIGTPDRARVEIGVETFADDVKEATSANEEKFEAVMDSLQQLGIAPEDIQTSNFSLWTEQQYGEFGPVGIAGYRGSNQISVTIRDIDQISDVLEAVVEAGANSIFGVNFTIGDQTALESRAREAAMSKAREKAIELADLGGVELGDIVMISEVIGQPMPFIQVERFVEAAGVGGGPSISPGQLTVQVQVQVTYGLQ